MSAAMVRREKVIFLLDNTTCDGKRRKEDCWRQKPYTRKAVNGRVKEFQTGEISQLELSGNFQGATCHNFGQK